MLENAENIDSHRRIHAGKLRRYHGESWLRKLLDFKTNLYNIRDVFLMSAGIAESLWFLVRDRPEAVFIKGGYVGVPVGLSCRLLGIPYMTHDSDSVPGLTNRIIGGGAKINAVGMPKEFYRYSKAKVVYVGVPLRSEFMISEKTQTELRMKLGYKKHEVVVLITGGSSGAQRLDKAMHSILADLLNECKDLRVIHQVGKNHENLYDDYPGEFRSRMHVAAFLSPMVSYAAAADLVVTRAGATTMAEFAALSKPAIVIPSPYLTGGHQLRNAEVFRLAGAAVIVTEQQAKDEPEKFKSIVEELIASEDRRRELAVNLHNLIPHDATSQLSKLILSLTK